MGKSNRGSTSYPLSMSFASLVDKARYVPSQEPFATLEEGSSREVALASAMEGSEDESWEMDEESKGVEGEGRGLVEGKSEREGDIQRLSQGLGGFLGEGSTLHGRVEGGDLME